MFPLCVTWSCYQDAAPDTPDSRAMNTRHALRQAQMSRELQELNRILSRKQELASQMDRSEEEMATMRAHYEVCENLHTCVCIFY